MKEYEANIGNEEDKKVTSQSDGPFFLQVLNFILILMGFDTERERERERKGRPATGRKKAADRCRALRL